MNTLLKNAQNYQSLVAQDFKMTYQNIDEILFGYE